MKKLLVLLLLVFALSFAFCANGTTTTGEETTVTDSETKWDQYLEPETPVIFNNIWPDDGTDFEYCIVILNVTYDTLEGEEVVLVDMTGLQDASAASSVAWAYNKKDISLKQDVDGDGKKDKFKCVDGEPKEMVKGQHQGLTDIAELGTAELFKWKIWFEKTNSAGLVFDVTKPFDFIENCSPGCSKFKNVWVQGG